jgi:hypothetical protein
MVDPEKHASLVVGARVHHQVREVITNFSSFEPVPTATRHVKAHSGQRDGASSRPAGVRATFTSDSAKDLLGSGWVSPSSNKEFAAADRLVIEPRHDPPHGCPLCPSNLCKVCCLPILPDVAPGSRLW